MGLKNTVAVLIFQGGPEDGHMVPLVGGVNSLGRQVGNQVRVEDVGVSRKHAEITERQDGYYLMDLSSNGTFVNGKRISKDEHLLDDGDSITLGPSKVSLLFRSDTAHTQIISLD